MIIWINGSFGSGKTSTAYELNRRLPNSYVYDPEEVGFFIRDNIPSEIKLSDFQDYPVWREFNNSMLDYISSKYNGIIIVPMTVVNEDYFKEIVDKINQNNIKHFTLMASKETLLKRLSKRGDEKNSWIGERIDRCITNLKKDTFKEHINTDDMTIDDVVNHISQACGLELEQDKSS